MREAISIYRDKEYITQVNKAYVFFKFPDGSQDRKKSRKQDLVEIYEWYKEEMQFYDRMHRELSEEYYKRKERFEKTHHYYTEEEIHAACLENRFANIDMEISNKYYLEDHYRISGILDMSIKMFNKYQKFYTITIQIQNVINTLENGG